MSKSLAPRKPGRPRDPRLRAQRKQQILDAAVVIFAKRGFDKTDLDMVARHSGVAKGTIYRYFRSKSALFLAAVDEGMNQLGQATNAARDAAQDPLDKITGAIRAYLTFFDGHQHFVELLIQERAQFKYRKKPTYFAYREANSEPWREMIAALIHGGRLRRMPVDRIVNVIGDLVYGTMFTNYFSGRKQSVDQQYHDVVDLVLHGILSEPERARLSNE